MDAKTFLIIATVVALGYLWFLNRLNKAVDPARLEMAELGEPMLGDANVPPLVRKQVRFYLDNAFAWWPAIVCAVVLPIAVIIFLIGYEGDVENQLTGASPKDKTKYDRVSKLFMISQIAANPIFAGVLLIEMVLFLIITLLLGRPVATVVRALKKTVMIDVAISHRTATA